MTIGGRLRTPSGRIAETSRSSNYKDLEKAVERVRGEYEPYFNK
jgi:hypothetical protein